MNKALIHTRDSEVEIPLFCDSHCHLDDPRFTPQLDLVLDNAFQVGVREILVPAVGLWNWDKILQLSEEHRLIYPALGLHPLYIDKHLSSDLLKLESYLSHHKCAAVGEIGLDFSLNETTFANQEHFLIEQLNIAQQYHLPVTLHSRKSHDILSKILKSHIPDAGGVVHGFTGSYEQAKKFVDLGLHIGVGGSITYPRAKKTRAAIARLPLDVLVLETDAPDMPIYGYQGKLNSPDKIPFIFQSLLEMHSHANQLDISNYLRRVCKNIFFSHYN